MRIACDKGGELMKKGRCYIREEHRQIVHETGQSIQSAEHSSDVMLVPEYKSWRWLLVSFSWCLTPWPYTLLSLGQGESSIMESYAGGRFGPGRLKSRPVGRYGYQWVRTLHNCTQRMQWGRVVKGWCDRGCHIRLSSLYTLHKFSPFLFSPRNQIECKKRK